MNKYDILVVNGPNLGRLGKRQPDIYGLETMDDLPRTLDRLMEERAKTLSLQFFQANSEGAIIDRLEQAHDAKTHGVILNAGAFTHTSLALADCLAWINIPTVEVHLSNIWARREPLRQQSFIGRHCVGVIAGFGLLSYALAVEALLEHLCKRDRADG